MEDDLIVVDDVEIDDDDFQPGSSTGAFNATPSGSFYGRSRPMNPAEHALGAGTSSRLRSGSVHAETSDRTTRSATARSKPQPKLKLKLSDKAAAQAPGMSFLGPYDRELDSDDEDLAFEEQFILRMPPGEDCERLKKMVVAREISNDVWFKFKGKKICLYTLPFVGNKCNKYRVDSRRATFHIGNSTYSSKLVDLPCIVESQKTLDNKQMFKVADICQVL